MYPRRPHAGPGHRSVRVSALIVRHALQLPVFHSTDQKEFCTHGAPIHRAALHGPCRSSSARIHGRGFSPSRRALLFSSCWLRSRHLNSRKAAQRIRPITKQPKVRGQFSSQTTAGGSGKRRPFLSLPKREFANGLLSSRRRALTASPQT